MGSQFRVYIQTPNNPPIHIQHVQHIIFALLVATAAAAPQRALEDEDYFDANPSYNYAFQISDDDAQTYIAKQESRDGDIVNGEYSYVDPLGSLIKVVYTAGPDGYSETRSAEPEFV